MRITETKVVCLFSKYEPNKSFILYIPDGGPIGDKFNVGPGYTGKVFPGQAAERFKTMQEAEEVNKKFLIYVKDKIKMIKKAKPGQPNPSFYQWK